MRTLALFVVAFAIGAKYELVSAQAFKEGDNTLTVGYGFESISPGDFGADDENRNDNFSFAGPFYLKYERGLTNKISVGVDVAYGFYTHSYNICPYCNGSGDGMYRMTATYSTYSVLAGIKWYFGNSTKFDPYIGVGLGYKYGLLTLKSNDPSSGNTPYTEKDFPIGGEASIGMRYYITNKIALYVEAGVAKSVVQTGLTFKLK